jgi:hypothetical protein
MRTLVDTVIKDQIRATIKAILAMSKASSKLIIAVR